MVTDNKQPDQEGTGGVDDINLEDGTLPPPVHRPIDDQPFPPAYEEDAAGSFRQPSNEQPSFIRRHAGKITIAGLAAVALAVGFRDKLGLVGFPPGHKRVETTAPDPKKQQQAPSPLDGVNMRFYQVPSGIQSRSDRKGVDIADWYPTFDIQAHTMDAIIQILVNSDGRYICRFDRLPFPPKAERMKFETPDVKDPNAKPFATAPLAGGNCRVDRLKK